MKISKVAALYISPTGNVRKTVCAMAEAIAQKLDVPMSEDDFTLTLGLATKLGVSEKPLVAALKEAIVQAVSA